MKLRQHPTPEGGGVNMNQHIQRGIYRCVTQLLWSYGVEMLALINIGASCSVLHHPAFNIFCKTTSHLPILRNTVLNYMMSLWHTNFLAWQKSQMTNLDLSQSSLWRACHDNGKRWTVGRGSSHRLCQKNPNLERTLHCISHLLLAAKALPHRAPGYLSCRVWWLKHVSSILLLQKEKSLAAIQAYKLGLKQRDDSLKIILTGWHSPLNKATKKNSHVYSIL